jgi:hypothetical protein
MPVWFIWSETATFLLALNLREYLDDVLLK